MYSELECGICFWTYNAGLRCPRELHCKHSFCERCLLALSRPHGPDESRGSRGAAWLIVCPLCRHTTFISGEGKVRAELRVDEYVLERLVDTQVLFRTELEEEKEGQVQNGRDDEEETTLLETTLLENDAEESDSSAGSSGGRTRRSWGKVWRKITGKRPRQRGRETYMTNDDMRHFALMSCYMF